MSNTCPVPTPEERAYGEIQSRIRTAMIGKIDAALQAAADQAKAEIEVAGLEIQPPAKEYFTAVIHQRLYCILCGADPDTFQGGRAETAVFMIRQSQNIAKHYWGANIEPTPKA